MLFRSIGVYYGDHKIDGDVVIHVINSALAEEFTCHYALARKNGVLDEEALARGRRGTKTRDAVKWWARFGLVVYDEVHMYCSKSRAEVFKSAQAQYMLGLSATPDQRIDKLDPIAIWNVGPVMNACEDVKEFEVNKTEYKTEVRVIKYRCENQYAEVELSDAGSVSVPRMLNKLVEDPDRNGIIV